MYTPWQGPSARYPVKRKLVFTPASAKRFRNTNTSKYSSFNKRTVAGPRTRGSLYSQVKSLQKVVKRISPEIKNLDVTITQANITTSGTITHISAIPGGSGANARVGNTVDLTGLVLRLALSQTSNGTYQRIYVIQDRQQVADTTPSITDIFSTAVPVNAQPNSDNIARFSFLWVSPMIEGTLVNAAQQKTVFEWSWKGSKKISFNGTASSDIEKNGLYVVTLSDQSGNTVDVQGTVRLQFTDA